ncbi:MAG TPA: sulfurtransferase [Terriglobales bacterium]|nr:sulfurtransferase [Terriglobales bacterium]
MKMRIGVAVLLATALVSLNAFAQRRSVSIPPLRSKMIVTTDWLADHLRNPKVVVLHVGRNRADYDAGHIPGARFLSLSDIAIVRDGIPNELPPVADLRKAFERVGVGDDTRAILYDEQDGLLAARAYFTLDYLGHGDRAALLDGGIEKWRSEERPVTNDFPKVEPASFTPKVNPKVLVKLPEVRRISAAASAGNSSTVLIDARPAEEFSGEKPGDAVTRAGHIPGARNLFWMENLESSDKPELKPPPELRKMWKAAGAVPGKRVVTYCRTGVQASHAYFTAKFLGYDAAMYDGSFLEWSNASDTKVKRSEPKGTGNE